LYCRLGLVYVLIGIFWDGGAETLQVCINFFKCAHFALPHGVLEADSIKALKLTCGGKRLKRTAKRLSVDEAVKPREIDPRGSVHLVTIVTKLNKETLYL